MNMHKNTRLTPHHRQAIWLAYTQDTESVTALARRHMVSRVTIYRALSAARGRLLKPQTSVNNRFKQARYGIKGLASAPSFESKIFPFKYNILAGNSKLIKYTISIQSNQISTDFEKN